MNRIHLEFPQSCYQSSTEPWNWKGFGGYSRPLLLFCLRRIHHTFFWNGTLIPSGGVNLFSTDSVICELIKQSSQKTRYMTQETRFIQCFISGIRITSQQDWEQLEFSFIPELASGAPKLPESYSKPVLQPLSCCISASLNQLSNKILTWPQNSVTFSYNSPAIIQAIESKLLQNTGVSISDIPTFVLLKKSLCCVLMGQCSALGTLYIRKYGISPVLEGLTTLWSCPFTIGWQLMLLDNHF